MRDPYQVLGVSPSATDDEVKKAYRDLARKYHPDNFVGNDLADLAQEKMKDINDAYDAIMKQRQNGGQRQEQNRRSARWGGFGGDSQGFSAVRQAIAMGQLARAEQLLSAMNDRNAEWYFLMGSVHYRKGWYDEARRHVETACSMDPGNAEYAQALNAMRQGQGAYRAGGPFGGGFGGPRSGMSACDCCTSLLCADCCCECMGGDCITCC